MCACNVHIWFKRKTPCNKQINIYCFCCLPVFGCICVIMSSNTIYFCAFMFDAVHVLVLTASCCFFFIGMSTYVTLYVHTCPMESKGETVIAGVKENCMLDTTVWLYILIMLHYYLWFYFISFTTTVAQVSDINIALIQDRFRENLWTIWMKLLLYSKLESKIRLLCFE